jgi:hypothetical protein
MIDKIGLYYGTGRVLVSLIIAGIILGIIRLLFKKYDKK